MAIKIPETGCECCHGINSSWVKDACWTDTGVGPGLGMTVTFDSPHQPPFTCFYAGVSYEQFKQFCAAASKGMAVYQLGYYWRAYKVVAAFKCNSLPSE